MKNFKNYIFTGIISIIPISITFWIIQYLFLFFSVPGKFIVDLVIREDIAKNYIYLSYFYIFINRLLGFLLTLIFLYLLGLIIKNVIGKRIYTFFELILENIPIINKIYKTIKSITNSLTSTKEQAFTKVVMIEYPKDGLWTLAMVTGESKDTKGTEYYNLFVPTTPNPTSGYLIMIEKSKTKDANITVDEGLSIVVSAGMIGPTKLNI
tara:strand:+ start:150 stop:776 length:627 start_codon:yes stop_codon:yes gene_type:complete